MLLQQARNEKALAEVDEEMTKASERCGGNPFFFSTARSASMKKEEAVPVEAVRDSSSA